MWHHLVKPSEWCIAELVLVIDHPVHEGAAKGIVLEPLSEERVVAVLYVLALGEELWDLYDDDIWNAQVEL